MDGSACADNLGRNRNFRSLWIGETGSQFGSAVSGIALPLVALLTLNASTLQVGVLAAFESVAWLLVGLPSGAWIDRMRLRLVLISSDAIRLAALGSIPLAYAFGVLTIGHLYVVALITSASTVFFDVAYQSFLPQLVERDALVIGNARLQAGESVAQVTAPILGGVLVQALTAPYAIVVDALSFLWSAIWIGRITTRLPKPQRKPDRHLAHEIKEGLGFVIRTNLLRSIAICTSLSNLCTSIVSALLYVLLARDLHLAAGVIGLLNAAPAVGGFLGSLVAPRLAKRFGQGPTIWVSAVFFAAPALVLPFVHRDWTLALMVVAQTVLWGACVIYNVTQVSFRQALCPPELMGRMNATMRFLVWGTMPLGALLGGVLGSTLGVRVTILIGVLGGLLAPLPVIISPLRTMHELPVVQRQSVGAEG